MIGRSSAFKVKRVMDILLALVALVLAGPLMVILAGLVRIHFGTPIFFRQERPGLRCQPFTIIKFRTMTDARDLHGNLLPDAQRLTQFGKFLRSSSLDELPELINVIRGEMSLVGPRPLMMKYVKYFRPNEQKRQDVRPGMTGWAQVRGRNYLPWDERLALDAWYVENWSLWLDIKILALTVWRVLTREGAVADAITVETDLSLERSADDRITGKP
ncbi:MAG: sugar transferase [Syntrophotaleaceae bacterium]